MPRLLLPVSVALLSCGLATRLPATPTSQTAVTVYGAPAGLEKIQGLEPSPLYSLTVAGQEAFVYRGFETRGPHEWYGNSGAMKESPSYDGVSYCNFSLNGPAALTISLRGEATDWSVLPTIAGARRATGNTLEIPLDGPRKFVVGANFAGLGWRYCIVSAEAPETNVPDRTRANVLYLGPGVHQFGQAWDPYVNGIDTVYIAGGAVVEATLKVHNKRGIKLLGRGLLAQAFVPHAEEVAERQEQEWDADWIGVRFAHTQSLEVDGIAVLNAPGYQMEFAKCEDVTVRNVKLCGFGEHNNDGFHTYGKNISVEDCFIASNDDRVCLTGLFDDSEGTGDRRWDGTNKLSGTPVENITLRRLVCWGLHNNGADIMLTWNGETSCKNVLVEDVASLTPTNKAFVASMHGGSAVFSNIVVRNAHLYHGNLVRLFVNDTKYQGAGGGRITDVTVENVTLEVPKKDIGKLIEGFNATSNIGTVTFKNLRASDGVVTALEETALKTNAFVGEVRFQP